MILNPRGTSGAGKSTFAIRIAALYKGPKVDKFADGRKQPLYTEHKRGKGQRGPSLFLLGHYATACGGCDTLKNTEHAFALAKELAPEGDVLMEGILVSEEFNRSLACHLWMLEEFESERFIVLDLSTPIEQCIANIKKRRAEKGDERELKTTNTENRVKRIASAVLRLKGAGVAVKRGKFDSCFKEARELLKL